MNMIRSAKNQIAELTAAAYRAAVQEGLLPEGVQTIPAVEIPKDTANGDYTTTFCLAAAKAMKMNPRQVAQTLIDNMALEGSYFTSVELAGPGFLNFRLGGKWYADTVSGIEAAGARYGENDMLAGKKYMVEFVSANPTGPMHMGNARGGVLGDTLAYKVDTIHTVLPTDTSLLQIEDGKDLVTLVTCTPFGVNTHRLLVRGHRVPYVPEQEAPAAAEKPVASSWTQHYLTGLGIGLGAVAVIGGAYFLVRRCRHA